MAVFPRVIRLGTAVMAFAIGLSAVLMAQPPLDDAKNVGDIRGDQEKNAELFKQFQKDLLSLAQKLERSERPEDKERAKVLFAALDLARKQGVDNQFQQLITGVASGKANTKQLDDIVGQDQQLRIALQEILNILLTDNEATRMKKEIAKLEAYLKEAKQIRQNQETIRAMTEAKKVDADRIAKNQKDLAERTKELGERMSGKDQAGKDQQGKDGGEKNGQEGEKGVAKSAPKPEAKSGDDAAESKGDDESPSGEGKPGEEGSDPKSGKPGDGASSEAKPMDKPGGDPKEGGAESKPGENADPKQDPAGTPRGGDPKEGGKPGEEGGKPGEKGGKPGEEGGKPGEKGGKPGEEGGKPGEPKSKDKPGEPGGKPESKPKGEENPSQGEPGGDGKGIPMDQESQPGDQKPSGQQGGQQGEPSQGGGQQPQQPQQPQDEQAPGRKQIQEAFPHQQGATEDLKKNNRDNAAKKEDKAIEELTKAIQELEKRLKQLREEEMLKLLANLEARTNRMLALQIEVYEATKGIDASIKGRKGEKATSDIQKAQQQADKEGEIILEANRTLKLLESEGSAVAFARVLEEVREDMIMVQRRLVDARVEKDTQAIEENIIAMLKDMALALKKAQEEMEQQQQEQQQQQQQQQQQGNQPLIDLIAELKLIRSMQMQVNSRTKIYGEQNKAEQSNDPLIQAELRQLAGRQAKLQDMINKIATGSNK